MVILGNHHQFGFYPAHHHFKAAWLRDRREECSSWDGRHVMEALLETFYHHEPYS
jgi:hypothetical protein